VTLSTGLAHSLISKPTKNADTKYQNITYKQRNNFYFTNYMQLRKEFNHRLVIEIFCTSEGSIKACDVTRNTVLARPVILNESIQ